MQRRRFFQQRVFYGGLFTGIILLPALLISANWLLIRIHTHTQNSATVTAGNMTFALSDDVLSIGMRLALQKVQTQSHFTVSHMTVTTQKGDAIQLNADGTVNQVPVFGSLPATLSVTFGPVVDKTGHIDFRVLQLSIMGIDASLFGLTNTILENTLNNQFSDVGQGSLVKGLDYQLVDVHTDTGALLVTAKLYQATPTVTPTGN